ncbi:MAG: hypothetical protein VCC99_06470 [Alphaproteobacteria bacterium]
MCSLCGMLGGRGHWTESTSHPEAFRRETPSTRGRERQQRTRQVNRVLAHYGLVVSDFSGTGYVLRTRTGRSAIIANLTELWAEAERLTGRACDPLDGALLTALEDS